MKYDLLVADDDDDDVLLLTKYIQDLNQSVTLTHVWNGAGVVKKLNEGLHPDLILIDALMPVMNGHELLAHLRSNDAWYHIPTVIWSGLVSDEDVTHYYRAGANSCVMKQDVFSNMDAFCRYWFGLVRFR